MGGPGVGAVERGLSEQGGGQGWGVRGRIQAASEGTEQGGKACWSDAEIHSARVWHLDSIPKAVTSH